MLQASIDSLGIRMLQSHYHSHNLTYHLHSHYKKLINQIYIVLIF